jgi:flagellar protein FliS
MQVQSRAIKSYGSVHVASSLAGARGAELTQLLFDGLVDALVALRGHIVHRSIEAKAAQVAKVQRIVMGLQSTLDFERGGDIARNLDELYGYVIRRLVHVHAYNDVEVLDEVTSLMREIRDAWRTLTPRPGAALVSVRAS